MRYLLFPGRHHLLTRFQAGYLQELADSQRDDVTVVFAVTSANHANTKRNPVPYDRREAAVERFGVLEGLRCLVVPVFDTAQTERFAEVTVKNVAATVGVELTRANTVVACSTPEVSAMYAALGFPIAGVEADVQPAPDRPWEVLLRCAAGDEAWRDLAHPASVDVFDRYGLAAHVRAVVNDPVVGAEGGLTATRDYRTYAEAFEDAAARKWAGVREHVRPGRIVDIGCGAGAVLALADKEPALRESDLIGIEVARHLYEECVHRKAQGGFSNPNVYFYQRNVLGGAVLPERSVDTTLTFALTHEIWSYGSGRTSLEAFVQAIFSTRRRAACGSTVTSAGRTSRTPGTAAPGERRRGQPGQAAPEPDRVEPGRGQRVRRRALHPRPAGPVRGRLPVPVRIRSAPGRRRRAALRRRDGLPHPQGLRRTTGSPRRTNSSVACPCPAGGRCWPKPASSSSRPPGPGATTGW